MACPITVSALEAASLDPWDDGAFWVRYADQFTPRFEFTDTLSPGDVFAAAEAEWHTLAAPGHAAGALIFYLPKRRLLITGDALWEHGMGVILPLYGDLNRRFVGLASDELGPTLIRELQWVGAIKLVDGLLVPQMAA